MGFAQTVPVCRFNCLTDGIGNVGMFSYAPYVYTLLGRSTYLLYTNGLGLMALSYKHIAEASMIMPELACRLDWIASQRYRDY